MFLTAGFRVKSERTSLGATAAGLAETLNETAEEILAASRESEGNIGGVRMLAVHDIFTLLGLIAFAALGYAFLLATRSVT